MPLSASSASAALCSERTWPGASGHWASMSATTRPNSAAAPTSTSGSRSRMNAFSEAEVPFAHVARTAPATSAAVTARLVPRRERSTMSAGS
jgi:hypothetical protein